MGNEVHLIFKDWEKYSAYYLDIKTINKLIKKIPSDKINGGIITIEPTVMKYNDISSKFVGYDIKVKDHDLFTLYIPNEEKV